MESPPKAMSVEQAVAQGIAAIRSGDQDRGHALLSYAVQQDPEHEQAWLWLSGAVGSEVERRQCLERVLALNPQNEAAQRGLAQLAPQPEAPAAGAPRPAPAPSPRATRQQQRPTQLEQKLVVKHKRVEASCAVEVWLDFLRNIATYDFEGDRMRKILGWSVLGLFVVGVIATIFTQSPLPLGLFAAVAVVVLAVYLLLRRKDLPNELRLFAVPLVAVLREDMDPEAELSLRLDLRGKTSKEKQVHQEKYRPDGGSYPKIVETHYVDPWMSGSATLADGSLLQWQIIDRVRERKITKRTGNGKIKTKYKYKIKTLLEASVKLRQDHYQLAPGAEPSLPDATFKVKPGRKRSAIRARRILVSRDVKAVPELQSMLELIGDAYGQATPTRGSA